MLTRLTALADDLTGANGLAGRWAGRGSTVAVAREALWLRAEAGCRVLDVETRLLEPAQARARVSTAWCGLGTSGLCFQKLDSTLRGNPGAEIEGFLLAASAPWVAVLPAYPDLGRQVLRGAVWVHGRRLDRSEYFRDPLSPAKTHLVPRLLPGAASAQAPLAVVARGPRALSLWLRRVLSGPRKPRLLGFDCAEAEHTRTIADACLAVGCRHFAGAADLGGALARRVLGPAQRVKRPALPWTILAGSVSATTFAQLQAWKAAGQFWGARLRKGPSGAWRRAQALPKGAALAALGQALALSSLERREDLGPWRRRRAVQGLDAEACAAEALADLVSWGLAAAGGAERRGWFVTGGHTLRVFWDAAGFRLVRILGEVLPEVPLGRAEGPEGAVWLCSKPGGFGDADCFVRFMGDRAWA